MEGNLMDALLRDIDELQIAEDVARLRRDYPFETARDLAMRAVRKAAAQGAALGAVAGALPIPWCFLGTMGEAAYLQYLESRLVLTVASLYGFRPDAAERSLEVLGCLGHTAGAVLGIEGIRRLVTAGGASALAAAVQRSLVATGVRSALGKALPLIGAAAGAAINYGAVQSCGRIAIAYYEYCLSFAMGLPGPDGGGGRARLDRISWTRVQLSEN